MRQQAHSESMRAQGRHWLHSGSRLMLTEGFVPPHSDSERRGIRP